MSSSSSWIGLQASFNRRRDCIPHYSVVCVELLDYPLAVSLRYSFVARIWSSIVGKPLYL